MAAPSENDPQLLEDARSGRGATPGIAAKVRLDGAIHASQECGLDLVTPHDALEALLTTVVGAWQRREMANEVVR